MQERVIEIIVHLLGELQQDRRSPLRVDLSHDLIQKGYTDHEITLAFSWVFNHLKTPFKSATDDIIQEVEISRDVLDSERIVIAPDAYGYLIQLIQLGVLRENEIESVIERAMVYGKIDINSDDIKSIVASIIFGNNNQGTFNGFSFNQGSNFVH